VVKKKIRCVANIFQSEGCNYDTHDVQLLLHSLGFVGKHPCDMLLHLQAELQTHCYMTEHYTIVDLLHVAGLVVQQLKRGASLQAAMLNACNDVYIKRQKEFSRRQVCEDLLIFCHEWWFCLNPLRTDGDFCHQGRDTEIAQNI
jgi:hypothetical protein